MPYLVSPRLHTAPPLACRKVAPQRKRHQAAALALAVQAVHATEMARRRRRHTGTLRRRSRRTRPAFRAIRWCRGPRLSTSRWPRGLQGQRTGSSCQRRGDVVPFHRVRCGSRLHDSRGRQRSCDATSTSYAAPSRPVHEVTCLEVFLFLRFYENLKAITDAEAAMRHRLARSSFAMSVIAPGCRAGARFAWAGEFRISFH